MEKSLYYSIKPLLSNTDCMVFMVVGGRGRGKTYSVKKTFIEDYIKKGKQFAYMMRYDSDFKNIDLTFNDVSKEFPDYSFKVEKHRAYIKKKKARKWEIMGYMICLSKAKTFKGTNYPDVYNILMDEFQIDTTNKVSNKYIPGEIKYFTSIIESFIRDRNGRVIMLSNAISITNPYFTAWNINPVQDKTIKKKLRQTLINSKGEPEEYELRIAVQSIPARDGFMDAKRKTLSGLLSMFSGMEESDIQNEYINDDCSFIQEKPKNAVFKFNVVIDGIMMGVWWDYDKIYGNRYYVSRQNNPTSIRTYCFKKSDIKENYVYTRTYKNIPDLTQLQKIVRKNQCWFQNQTVKSLSFDIFTILNIY